MKKLIVIVAVLFFGIKDASARLYLKNNTNCEISCTVFCSGITSEQCGAYQSQLIVIPANTTLIYNTTADLGSCYVGPSYTTMAIPPASQNWESVKFSAGSSGCVNSSDIGNCSFNGLSWTGTCDFCGGSVLNVTWTTVLSNNTVTFSN